MQPQRARVTTPSLQKNKKGFPDLNQNTKGLLNNIVFIQPLVNRLHHQTEKRTCFNYNNLSVYIKVSIDKILQ